MKMLRKKDTGELFKYTDILASRNDMELVTVEEDEVLPEDNKSSIDKKKKDK